MRITRMLGGGFAWNLSDDQNVLKLKAAVVHAIRSGGGLVEVLRRGDAEVTSLVISSGVAIVFESREVQEGKPSTEAMFDNQFDWDLDA